MPRIPIDNIDDERIGVYRDLLSAKASRRSGFFVAEGVLLVERLLASSFETHSVLVTENRLATLPELPEDTLVYVAPPKLIEAVVGYNFHRGMLACGVRPPLQPLDKTLAATPNQSTLVVCVGIQDPTNLGSILRSSAAFGITAIVLGNRCSDPLSRRVLRVSMGASLTLPIVEADDILNEVMRLDREFGYECVATVLQDAEVLERATRSQRTAILIGNEAHGLPDEISQACNRRVTIPMQLGTDSLNAAVATGIMLHHFTRVASSTRS